MSESEASLPLIAVTAAVGAIVLLFTLLCSVFRREKPTQEGLCFISFANEFLLFL